LASDGVVLSITNWLVWWNVEKSQWHAHVGGLWTHVANNKKQKKIKMRMKTIIIFVGKGNEIVS